jgi:hypothetical protein
MYMASFDKDGSFLRRTAQEAERRAASKKHEPDTTAGILPIFWSNSFIFKEGEEPDHINKFATLPRHLHLFEVLGGTDIDRAYALAVDVPSFAMASLLSAARVRLLMSTKSKLQQTENIWIVRPDKVVEHVNIDELSID